MLTYDFENIEGPLYEYIYRCIKDDIISGKLRPDEKLPSKRAFANNNGISTITIQNAYDQLISEGYVYTLPKRGYYVADIEVTAKVPVSSDISYDVHVPAEAEKLPYDLSNNGTNPDNFPFSIWARMLRDIMTNRKEDLMRTSPTGGVRQLREAIANHLRSFRGMLVDPDQIVVGAGTEYLYGLLIQLLGNDKTYVIENPGYKKLVKIYAQRDIECRFASMDDRGVTVSELLSSNADVAHICPNHHFPTGITMPANRRYEILAWANEKNSRYIIEDDYDSEFRSGGKPIPTLFSIDACEKVIYINTFSKSLTPTIRISYMVLPVHLANRFYDTMSFYSCTVSNFEQYTLAQFIEQGYFEKHINRMRLFYKRQRQKVIDAIQASSIRNMFTILENDSGLHFLLKLKTDINSDSLRSILKDRGIKVNYLSDYYLTGGEEVSSHFIINYSSMKDGVMESVLHILEDILKEG